MALPDRLRALAPVALLASGLFFLAAERTVAGTFGLPLDDAWIHATFARNLASGEGFAFDRPGQSVSGSTAPLWTGLLALVLGATGHPVLAARVLGLAAGALAVLAAARLARAATGDPLTGGLAGLLVGLSARFVWGSLSGMEVPLYTGLVCLGLALHLQRRRGPFRHWLPAAGLLALAGFARPECFVFLPLAAVHRGGPREAATALALLVAFPLFHLAVHGQPLPTTFHAKTTGFSPLRLLTDSPLQVLAFLGWLPTHLPLVAVGLATGVARGLRERNGVPFLVVALLLFAVARGALGLDAPSVQYGRYYGHAWPLFLIVCLHGMDLRRPRTGLAPGILLAAAGACLLFPSGVPFFLLDHGAPPASAPLWGWAVAPAAAFGLLAATGWIQGRRGLPGRPPSWALGVWLAAALAAGAGHHARNVRDTDTLNVAMARAVGALVPQGETVACHDVGALGYFAGRPLLDLAGIATPEAALGPRDARGFPDAVALLEAHRPRFLAALDGWMGDRLFPAGTPPPGLREFRELLRIDHPANITLAGPPYYLLELVWE